MGCAWFRWAGLGRWWVESGEDRRRAQRCAGDMSSTGAGAPAQLPGPHLCGGGLQGADSLRGGTDRLNATGFEFASDT